MNLNLNLGLDDMRYSSANAATSSSLVCVRFASFGYLLRMASGPTATAGGLRLGDERPSKSVWCGYSTHTMRGRMVHLSPSSTDWVGRASLHWGRTPSASLC